MTRDAFELALTAERTVSRSFEDVLAVLEKKYFSMDVDARRRVLIAAALCGVMGPEFGTPDMLDYDECGDFRAKFRKLALEFQEKHGVMLRNVKVKNLMRDYV